ncbi:hypothetical protein JCM9140_674 [Halalkalibacter wakoensis JCM 9140]|uniref:Uncharacterized protein n=1 Tax=Halalkalibacter wakoensis JCM 9140 TaxID=1236970 RepID=W4PZ11_9BACI|nr:hypothetical protein [Halalkalibacter wakoensis]GAE24723.1 hypothetical protein JCM9140_674 [Halalkalibacter wakoensis JCM 9140]
MDEKRKEIIVNEIKNWKETKLLPAHYCDFLLTLYTEGQQDDKETKQSFVLRWYPFVPFIVIHLLFLLTIVVIYFTDFSNVMQIAIAVPFVLAIILIGSKSAHTLLSSYYFMIAAVLFYLVTVQWGSGLGLNPTKMVFIITLIHCVSWVVVGWRYSLRIFQLAGIVGLTCALFLYFQ